MKLKNILNEGYDKPQFYPAKLLPLFRAAITKAFKDGIIRVPGLDASEYSDYAEDIAALMLSKKTFIDAVNQTFPSKDKKI